MGLIATLILGLIAGWLTGMVMKGNGGYGIIGDIVLGILGAIVGGWLTGKLLDRDMVNGFNIESLIVAVLAAGAVPGRPDELASLGEVRREHRRARDQALDKRPARRRVEQYRPTFGDHHRVQDDRRVGDEIERLLDRVDRGLVTQHADLDGVDADVGRERAHLRDDHVRRDRENRVDADGALGGYGRDRRHPVHTGAGEGLQVRLDAGAAAGVGAGDREDCWRVAGGRAHHPCTLRGSFVPAEAVSPDQPQ